MLGYEFVLEFRKQTTTVILTFYTVAVCSCCDSDTWHNHVGSWFSLNWNQNHWVEEQRGTRVIHVTNDCMNAAQSQYLRRFPIFIIMMWWSFAPWTHRSEEYRHSLRLNPDFGSRSPEVSYNRTNIYLLTTVAVG